MKERSNTESVQRALLCRRLLIIALLLSGLIAAVLWNLVCGASHLPLDILLKALFSGPDDHLEGSASVILWQLRLPMVLMSAVTGLSLGLAGAEMQTVLDNPLASPFTLGLSAASAFGASLAIILGLYIPGLPSEWSIAGNAFLFSIGSAFLLEMVVRLRGASAETVILFGIAMVFAFQAMVSMLQFVASEDSLQDLVFWTMGSVTRADWTKLTLLSSVFSAVMIWSFRDSLPLTALRFGDDRAAGLGVDVRRVRLAALIRISLLAALAVAFSGTIGFVGLVAPHIARRLVGEDHRLYLPAAALSGGIILCLACLAARTLVPGEVLPVGIMTALVGVPFFLGIVLRREKTE